MPKLLASFATLKSKVDKALDSAYGFAQIPPWSYHRKVKVLEFNEKCECAGFNDNNGHSDCADLLTLR